VGWWSASRSSYTRKPEKLPHPFPGSRCPPARHTRRCSTNGKKTHTQYINFVPTPTARCYIIIEDRAKKKQIKRKREITARESWRIGSRKRLVLCDVRTRRHNTQRTNRYIVTIIRKGARDINVKKKALIKHSKRLDRFERLII